jgi:3-oxoacyl-[acyl-carrier protein] reductase
VASDELVSRYDEHGTVVGAVARSRMRAQGLWHAATLVLVRSGDGRRVYVHRRSPDKDVYPGLHDCWAGGVVAAGETPEQGARRELAEELGVTGVPLTELFRFRYVRPPVRYHAFAYEVRWDGPVVHQPEEIVAGGWMELAELRERLADPEWPFVPDGREAIERWFAAREAATADDPAPGDVAPGEPTPGDVAPGDVAPGDPERVAGDGTEQVAGPRRVLVTGASRGIGRAIALAFAQGGDRVAVQYASRRADAEDTLRRLPGTGHTLIEADLGDPGAPAQVVAAAVTALGGVDVLVNNAAVAPSPDTRHSIADVPLDAWQQVWRRTLEVNVLGAADLTWAVARHLIERGAGGSIVNVGSRGAFRGEPDHPAYGASKAALHAFGQSMAVALAPYGIAVTSVAPGFVATERQAATLRGPDGDRLRGESPFGRVGTPEEIAAAVRFLASPAASWASGAVVDLNGASYLRT